MAARVSSSPQQQYPGGVPYLLPLPALGPYGAPDIANRCIGKSIKSTSCSYTISCYCCTPSRKSKFSSVRIKSSGTTTGGGPSRYIRRN